MLQVSSTTRLSRRYVDHSLPVIPPRKIKSNVTCGCLFMRSYRPRDAACGLTLCCQLIKKLSATPTLLALNDVHRQLGIVDSQAALQANKATFFFQLVSQQCF